MGGAKAGENGQAEYEKRLIRSGFATDKSHHFIQGQTAEPSWCWHLSQTILLTTPLSQQVLYQYQYKVVKGEFLIKVQKTREMHRVVNKMFKNCFTNLA